MDAGRDRKAKHAHGGGHEHGERVCTGQGIFRKVAQAGQGVWLELARSLAPRAVLDELWEISAS